MSEQTTGCTGNCSSCSENCESRAPESLLEKPNALSNIKKVIAVVSGKGGVGKSTVTSMLATLLRRRGYETGVLDADITGPSIPKAFGINKRAEGNELGIFPAVSETGIKIMSVNLLLEDPNAPVVWRGPVIAGAVKQFWTDVIWGDTDFLLVDCPPGTGDVPLTVFQSLPIDGIIIVTTPQDLVSMIVKKAYTMAEMMKVPVLGIVENMSYAVCPDCGKKIYVFSEGKTAAAAEQMGVPLLAEMPLNSDFTNLADNGCIEHFASDCLDAVADTVEKLIK